MMPLFTPAPEILIEGYCLDGFEKVQDAFIANFEKGKEGGAAFAAYLNGEIVVDLCGGYKNVKTKEPWKEDTMTMAMSTTKGVCAICVAILADKGLLDYDEPVAKYWPEFAQNGKEKITVKTLLSHQAGLIQLDEENPLFEADLDFVKDPEKIGAVLAKNKPLWEPETRHAYHGVTIGWYMDQLVRRIDTKHRSIGQFFKEEVAEPFDIDFHIGLPPEMQSRVAYHTYHNGQAFPGILLRKQFWNFLKFSFNRNSLFMRSVSCMNQLAQESMSNSPEYQQAEVPLANGIGTARALAKLFGILANGGEDISTGKRLLSESLIQILSLPVVEGHDIVHEYHNAFSLGPDLIRVEDNYAFGHSGFGGQAAYACPSKKLSWCYLTNRLVTYGTPEDDPRWSSVKKALISCVNELKH